MGVITAAQTVDHVVQLQDGGDPFRVLLRPDTARHGGLLVRVR
jgi:hypothetical protein